MKKRYFSGSPWEKKAGYCRAIQVGKAIEVSGTVAVDMEGNALGTTVGEQTRAALGIILHAIRELGGKKEDIIRTRIYCTDMAHSDDILTEHARFFKDEVPVTTLIEVSAFIRDEFLVEIEASALVGA